MSPNMRGAALMTAAMLMFAVEDAFIKWISAEMTVGLIILAIGLLGTAVFMAIARAQGHRVWTPEMATAPILLRMGGEAAGSFFFISALALTPLATATAIFQASPLVVTLGAVLFLGARVGWRRWLAILVGFGGVLLILRPGFDGFDPFALLSLGAVLSLSVRDLATRVVPASVPSMVLAVHGLMSLIPVGGVLLLVSGGSPLPGLGAGIGLLLATLAGLLAYYFIVSAMRIGDVAVVTSFRYTRMFFGLVIAVIVFGERPDLLTLVGAAIIVGAGLFTLIREAQMARAQARAARAVPPLR